MTTLKLGISAKNLTCILKIKTKKNEKSCKISQRTWKIFVK